MSFFYASPVEGEMHLHDLETAVSDRIGFLQALVTGGELKYSEFLLEGTAYDNAGHFVLCIVTALTRNSYLAELVRTGEVQLFERRLAFLTPSTLHLFAKKILRYIKRNNFTERYSEALYALCTKMSLKHVAEHICLNHSDECTRHIINVHFTLCLPFVAKRKAELKCGQASIPCGTWLKYLTILFKMHLSTRDKFKNNLEIFRNDDRIMTIVSQYVSYGRDEPKISSSNKLALLSREVDKQSRYFPPCMKNLQNVIRKHHRLSHDQRFYYTCFLKDIGMPVSEAVRFWQEEYSKGSCTSACQHSWAADGAKYVRSIRHTYGLEGSRTSYSCAGCHKIQSSSSARTEGGCPFKTFSDNDLKSVLHPDFQSGSHVMSTIHACRKAGHYSKACKLYLLTMFSQFHDCDQENSKTKTLFLSPVKFYAEAVKTVPSTKI